MGDPVTATLGVIAGGASLFSGYEGYEAGQAQQNALREQLLQVESATKQKQINRLQDLNQTIGNANLVGATQGYDLSSTSFNTPTLEDLNRYAEDANGDLLSLNFQQQAIDQQIQNAGAQGNAALFEGLAGGIRSGVNLYGNKLFEHTPSAGMGAQMSQAQYYANDASLIPQNTGLSYDQYRRSLFPSSYIPEG